MFTVTTKKIKCDGEKYKGYHYFVDVTDGKETVSFVSDSEGHIDFSRIGDVTDENGTRYILGGEHELYLMRSWYKGGNIKKLKARMLDFVDKVLAMNIEVKFTADVGILTYTA